MKRLFPILLLLANIVSAQHVKVNKLEQLTKVTDGIFAWAEFIPQSDNMLISKPGYEGLYLLNGKTKAMQLVTEEKGAGYKPAISPDGKKIVYRSNVYQGARKFSTLQEFDIKTQSKKSLVAQTRNLSPAEFVGNELIYNHSGKKKSVRYDGMKTKRSSDQPYVRSEKLKPVIYRNNTAQKLLPNGNGNYIWASLSPDGTKMVYNFNGTGTYVSDLKGNIVAELGRFHAPRWLNNDILVGMNDKDDGHKMISSLLIQLAKRRSPT